MLELRRRGERDFLICQDGRVLMTSSAHRSEAALAELSLAHCARRRNPRVLIGGLGMGFTLRAALDALGPRARIAVAELHPAVVDWCRGPLATLTDGAVLDPRVQVERADVAELIRDARPGSLDAILLDLFVGPRRPAAGDPWFGREALERTRLALSEPGALAVWAEQPDRGFEKALAAAGFGLEWHRPGRGGLRHVVYVALRAADTRGGRPRGSGRPRRSSAR